MWYVSGIFALNLPCSLDTSGDWHTSALDWNRVELRESNESIFGDWGVEILKPTPIQQLKNVRYVANTLRALTDLLEEGKFGYAQGAKEDFITNPVYFDEFFEHVAMLRGTSGWSSIDRFMCREFGRRWWKWNPGR